MLNRLKQWMQAASQPLPSIETAVVPAPRQEQAAPGADCLLLIDVRSQREFAAVAIEGALNLPLPDVQRGIGALAADLATPIALYCASGGRSEMACQMLKQLGYVNVSNAGGVYAAAATLGRNLRH